MQWIKPTQVVALSACLMFCFLLAITRCWDDGSSYGATTEESPAAERPPQAAAPKPADNSECLVCHADFKEETLSAKHEKAGVGCPKCHGPSADHGDDELNIMLPDVLFGRSEIAPFCTTCHKKEDHPAGEKYEAFVNKWKGKYRPNGRVIRSKAICTDCHGNHAVLSPDQMQFDNQ